MPRVRFYFYAGIWMYLLRLLQMKGDRRVWDLALGEI